MTSQTQVGIWGIGTELPPHIRGNDFWPKEFVEGLESHKASDITLPKLEDTNDSIFREVLQPYESDPFRGAYQRRVAGATQHASDLEAAACRKALEQAEVRADEIDELILTTMVPDLLASNQAALVHHKVGLREDALTMALDVQCSGFIMAMMMAEASIRSGRARRVLIAQSAVFSRIMPYERPFSVNFGDGAAAAVIGPVSPERGLLASSWFNDGEYHRAVCLGPGSGKDWWEANERLVATSADVIKGKEQIFRLGVLARKAVHAALNKGGLTTDQVDYFACHQPTAWFADLCSKTIGFEHVPKQQTFAQTAGVGGANVLLNIEAGIRQGQVRPNQVVVAYSCGSGMTFGASVLRWGR